MIVTIADDFTGAAEMAGLGWRFGFRTTLCNGRDGLGENVVSLENRNSKIKKYNPAASSLPSSGKSHRELVVFNTASRDCPPAAARRRVAQALAEAQRLRPEWIYKKVDSVLRG